MKSSLHHIMAVATIATAAAALACGKSDMPIKTTSSGGESTSPAASTVNTRGMSLVRVVNAVDAGKDVAVALAGQPMFADVRTGAASEYREVALNLAQFTVRVQDSPEGMVLAEKDRVLMDGNRYTVFLVADDAVKRSLKVVRDDVIPDSGKARIRVFNAAPNAPPLDVTIAGGKEKLFSGVGFKDAAGFADVVPGPVTIQFRGKGETTVLLTVSNLELSRSTSTTIVVTGARKLQYFTFSDALMAPVAKTP